MLKNKSPEYLFKIFVTTLTCISFVWSCKPDIKNNSELFFNANIAEDATPVVIEQILLNKENPISKIFFEKGTYHFYPDKGLETFVHISNHNDVMTRTAFPIKNFKNLIIDGNGSTFIFHGRMIPFLIEKCSNVTILNLNIDWAMSFHSEALVVANDVKNNSFDLQISDEYPYIIKNEQLLFIKEYYNHSIGQTILYDTARRAIAFNTETYTPLTTRNGIQVKRYSDKIHYKYPVDPRCPDQSVLNYENRLICKEIKPGRVRIYNHSKELPPVGHMLVCKGENFRNRLSPAIRISHTDGFYANNVNIHHAGGMGLIAENSSDLILDKVNVVPSKGRMVSTTADATHFVGCRGKIELKNCTFNNQLDDASNVHGSYQIIQDVIDEYSLGVRMGHFQQQGFTIGRNNDTIGLIRLSESFFPYKKLTIHEIKYRNGRYQIISFNEPVPPAVQVGDLIENLSAYPTFLVENCTISRNRARGLLLSTPREILIKNNYFNTEMEALLMPVESSFWYESGSVTNLLIEHNTFQDCNHSGLDRGIIRFETDDNNENIAFRNIQIRNNTIDHFDNLFLEISNTNNLTFEGNTITSSNTFTQLFPDNPAIIIEASKNISFKNNTYNGKAKKIIQTDSTMSKIKFY